MKQIKTALLSVSDKTGIVELAAALAQQGVKLVSTGGTARLLREKGIAVADVADLTGFPEMMDGRVKTLHPAVHGGILAIRSDAAHREAMETHGIGAIDLVVVNLYPFEETVAKGASFEETIEQIDIGGPAMIRSAAKNHDDVAVLVDPADYAGLLAERATHDGATTPELRRRLAQRAFARTARYDAAIASWMAEKAVSADRAPQAFAERFEVSGERVQNLRYGENPHQRAAFYRIGPSAGTLAGATQLQGKELSYNNLNDTDAALQLVHDLFRMSGESSAVIVKHANPCGAAVGRNALEAYTRALACDPKSAFGGIIALTCPVDGETASAIAQLFAEVVIAPRFEPAALDIFSAKKNLRLLALGDFAADALPLLKTISGGLLVQEQDRMTFAEGDLPVATKRQPTVQEKADLKLAFTVAKHVKSNAIVLVKDGRTHGIGAGQMSRVDSVHLACRKAEENGLGTAGTVLASDAFFPFDDNVLAAAEAGVTALIQPGGSVRDDEVVAAADRHDLAMLMTGIRHFRH